MLLPLLGKAPCLCWYSLCWRWGWQVLSGCCQHRRQPGVLSGRHKSEINLFVLNSKNFLLAEQYFLTILESSMKIFVVHIKIRHTRNDFSKNKRNPVFVLKVSMVCFYPQTFHSSFCDHLHNLIISFSCAYSEPCILLPSSICSPNV